jgi:5'-nucleotidase
VVWDSSKPPKERVQEVWLLEKTTIGPDGKSRLVDKEQILRSSTRKCLMVCGEYMAMGGDGYDALKKGKLVINGESGQPKAALVKKYLLGKFLEATNTTLL